ncbi:MAG TPA: aminotransferase class IV [Conexibacter sp.]|nr:aminotransferase class IV [Conexibacter sp.]
MSRPLQPERAQGVFSTLLVVAGVPQEFDAHLARMHASLRELYDLALPPAAVDEALALARPLALARLRVAVAPGAGGEAVVTLSATAIEREIVLPGRERALELRSVSVADWQGAHKWVDRRLLESLDAAVAPAGALLLDAADGAVLETTRANIFAVGADGVLRTPPADGAILPGINRALLLSLARELGFDAREERLALADLAGARELFTSGSVRGVEPVGALDGTALDGPGEVAVALAGALGRRWFG